MGYDVMKKTCAFLLLVALFLAGCSSRPEPESRLYRFIDNLDELNIVLHPMTQVAQDPSVPDKMFPAESSLLMDLGSGNNPYGIKRKLMLKGRVVNALYCPPKSVLRYRISPPENAKLDFGIAVVQNENLEEQVANVSGEKRGTTFLVNLEAGGRRQNIFQRYLPPLEAEETFAFQLFTVDLPDAQDELDIVFETDGDGSSRSFWVNPLYFQKQEDNLNVILISVDTLRADHLGCYGYDRATSSHIDTLASDGVTFLNAYASSPWTLPSHISLMTSLHGVNHQVAYEDESLDPSIPTLADILRMNQYYCAALTGGGFVSAQYGFSKGFNSYSDEGGILRQDSAEHLFHSALRWLEREKDKGFFLFLHTFQPHSPYACPTPYRSAFLGENARWRHIDLISYLGGMPGIYRELPENDRRNIIDLYDGEIRYTDETLIGPLIAALKDMGLYDRTLIVFTSDHGEEFFDHHGWGHGHSLYDESLKVPLIIKFPDSRFQGRKIADMVPLVDIFPTILEEAGIEYADLDIDGQSLFPLITGEEKGDRGFLADLAANVLASRIPQRISMSQGKEKLILNREMSPEDLGFFITPPPVLDPVEFYDLAQDPDERRNIVEERAASANRIIRRIDEVYKAARKRKTGKLTMGEELRKQLKALGYIR
jgi:arylsulfatase A-like enzyme